MSDIRQASNPRKRLCTAFARGFDQNVTIACNANPKYAIPRKTLSTAASEDALPPIKKRKASSPSEEPYPSDPVTNTVRLREALENRTLFCHNAPDVPGIQFRNEFNTIMQDNKLSFLESAILWCSQFGPHDFKMIFMNADMATRALNLDGFTLRDRRSIRIRRPREYNGPDTHTWNNGFATTRPHYSYDIKNTRKEKDERAVYVKHVPLGTDHDVLNEFLRDAINRASLNICEGNPITSCKVKGNTAIIFLRTSEEAAATLNLNNVPFRGARLLFERHRNGRHRNRRHQNLHHHQLLEISGVKDTHRAPCPQRWERSNFESQGSQLPISMIPPTSGDGSCCSRLPRNPPSNHEDMVQVVALKEEDLSTPPRPKKRVIFNLKEEDGRCGRSDGKAKYQACAKVGEKSAELALVTRDCHTTVDEHNTNYVQAVLDKVNEDRGDISWQLEKANVEKAQLQQRLSEMEKRLAESDASRVCFVKSELNEKREASATQQQLVIMHKIWGKTAHELEYTRQQLQEATESRIETASIRFKKPLLGPSIKQEESFLKCEEGGIQYTGSEQVRAMLEREEEFWDV